MNLEELESELNIILTSLRVPYHRVLLGKNLPEVFEAKDFGVVVVGIHPQDYSVVLNKLVTLFKGRRYIIVATTDNILEVKDEIIWDFMRSGYMRYIRTHYNRQFNNLIQQGFGRKIINERLKVWDGDPKYSFLIEENKEALQLSEPVILNYDPAFYDYMPEKTNGE